MSSTVKTEYQGYSQNATVAAHPLRRQASDAIRMDRVERARARLASGDIPTSAEALADILLRAVSRERLCRE